MKPANLSLLCAVMALCFSSSASAVTSLDQRYTPTSPLMVGTVSYTAGPNLPGTSIPGPAQTTPSLAQTFEVGVSGQLTAVDLLLSRTGSRVGDPGEFAFGPLTISLFSVSAGKPSALWAATTLLPSAVTYAPNTGAWVNVDFSAQKLSVNAGEQLAIVLHKPGTGVAFDNDTFYGFSLPTQWYGGLFSDYAKGDAFMADSSGNWNKLSGYFDPAMPGSDFGFRTYVTAVPEPETYAMFLAGLGLLGLCSRGRKLPA